MADFVAKRESQIEHVLYRFAQDFRYSFRLLVKSPIATVVAVVSLALGIGANAAIFSLVNSLVLRSLPVHDPGQLVSIVTVDPNDTEEQRSSLGMFEEIRKHKELFSSVFIWNSGFLNLDANGMKYPGGVDGVSGDYFSTLGIKPLLGRFIQPDDVALHVGISNQVAVISYSCWRRHYGGDPHVLGQTIRVESRPVTIIGVMPEDFSSLGIDYATDVIVPLGYTGNTTFRKPGRLSFSLFARLEPNVSLKQARTELKALWPHIQQATVPEGDQGATRARFLAKRIDVRSAATGSSYLRQRFSRPLTVLMGLVALVLLIACINLANLMLARAANRQQEIGIRAALGANGWALARQLLIESLLLSVAGAILGFLVAFWASRFLVHTMWNEYDPLSLSVAPDTHVLFFTSAIAVLAGILVGLVPALRAKRMNPVAALKQGSRGIHGQGKFARVLVAGQVALSLVLVVGATLFVRSMDNLLTTDPGFRRDHLLIMALFPQPGRKDIPNRSVYFHELADNLSRIPGVTGVSYSYYGPAYEYEFREPVTAASPSNVSAQAMEDIVGPGFFHVIGMRVLAGREFSWQDDEHAPHIVILSESLANKLFPNENPIGRMIEVGAKRDKMQVAGVVNSASLWRVQSHEPMAVYVPLLQRLDYNEPNAAIHTSGDPLAIASVVRRTVEKMGLQYPLGMKTGEARARKMLASESMVSMLSAFMGGLALFLAAIGLYGLMSYAVARRTSEMGIRMALGARPADVQRLILNEVLLLVMAGISVGIPAALMASRLIAGMLFGLSATDPLTIGLSISIVLSVALVAGYWPARRASRVDPMTALRAE